MNSIKVKIVVVAICASWSIAASAANTDATENVLTQSSTAIEEMKLGPMQASLSSQCVSDLVAKNQKDRELIESLEPRLRAAFKNVCAIAYSGKFGRQVALFLTNPLRIAAEKAGNQRLARIADMIIERFETRAPQKVAQL